MHLKGCQFVIKTRYYSQLADNTYFYLKFITIEALHQLFMKPAICFENSNISQFRETSTIYQNILNYSGAVNSGLLKSVEVQGKSWKY